MKNRRGSAAVLLTIAFAGMLVLVVCLFAAAKNVAGVSYADAAFQAAGRSVLSEYDTKLLSEYGLFAFKGDERRIERDIAFYANASLKKDTTAYFPFVPSGARTKVFDIGIDKMEANLKEFSLMDADTFEGQLRKAALSKTAKKLAGGKESGGKDYSDPLSGHPNRTLRNEGVIAALPSADVVWSFPDVSSLSPNRLSRIADSAAADTLTSQYILAAFGHANDGVSEEESFFDAEAEYILSGRKNDRENYDSIKTKLTLIRFAANNLSLYRDPAKVAQAEALAAPFAAAFGVGEMAAYVTIMELWAGAETKNDIGLFEAGKNVAFVKTPAQWALTNGAKAIEGLFDGVVVTPAVQTGGTYEDYLRILLFLMDRETKLLRVMDLIQMDMKVNYNRDFLLREYYAGYRLHAEALGETFEYTERY
ncbi:MAG: DUF5702 domain-containing protein [Clostridiales Family XIII bacterium]|jgi:hypothetical protein|nr:DUF5702 domain-containing protein [Clostridiales Family XIII bacterium]